MLGFQENQSFFHVTLTNYQFMYTVCVLLKALFNKWVERMAVRGAWRPLSGLICEIVNSVGQGNFTFVREKSGNFKHLWLWQPWFCFRKFSCSPACDWNTALRIPAIKNVKKRIRGILVLFNTCNVTLLILRLACWLISFVCLAESMYFSTLRSEAYKAVVTSIM